MGCKREEGRGADAYHKEYRHDNLEQQHQHDRLEPAALLVAPHPRRTHLAHFQDVPHHGPDQHNQNDAIHDDERGLPGGIQCPLVLDLAHADREQILVPSA
ncbi:hypothetical protein AMAG_18060 [Allomyces macrogynus ATCC 38327]|uniref:Uncharacterized protein n=1 Tax=Allomyces macrogynus (strain ATCC 38327) TaxID=578462 RepID=A0A0L0S4R9_ALLM3|nr:hypothetical protein AMAG_18060 [Allomyces macrogynus ATCC 38327]|eukprot:KNE57513.1 hypothetical protein AMAG_18060 [Allomyces macrogynus ATCC 38327]